MILKKLNKSRKKEAKLIDELKKSKQVVKGKKQKLSEDIQKNKRS